MENNLIIVDGAVGIGKTSLVELLNRELNYKVYTEIFQDEYGLLEKYYSDGKKWCFPMQLNFLNNRYTQYIQASKLSGNIIMDRSIYSDPIFAELYLEKGDLDLVEYGIYQKLYKNLVTSLTPPRLLIYLECSLVEVVKRIKKRGRKEELIVPDEYWKELNDKYYDHYSNYKSTILRIDVSNLDFVNNPQDAEVLVKLIKLEIEKCNFAKL